MYKSNVFFLFSIGMLFILLMMSCSNSDVIINQSVSQLGKFETVTISFKLTQPFENPYDPDDICVDAIIITPGNDTLTLPCFYKSGTPQRSLWEARYTPMEIGTHSYHIRSISTQDTIVTGTRHIMVIESNNDGFLRLNSNSNYSLVFDSGKRFRGVGLNIGWEMQSEYKYPYETYFNELEKNHANFLRTWMCTWNLPLEWTRVPNFETLTDEFENWDRTFSHTNGLKLLSEKQKYTADDSDLVTLSFNTTEKIIYYINDIRRFKMKVFYQNELSTDRIKCYTSTDNKTYTPLAVEFSQDWNHYENWRRLFVCQIKALPDGINYLKIEFLDHMKGTSHIADIAIEHGEPTDVLDAPGLGRYYQKTANKLDSLLEQMSKQGLYLMLTHDYHGVFKSFIDRWGSNAEWRANPYNKANGGPCETPADFFTNEEARHIYKKKLRYMVARWGYSTHLAVWEFWNEIDNVMEWQQVPAEAIVSWHAEMALYLKQIDPYKHLVSTSVVRREVPGLWDIPDIDFTQRHNYGPTSDMHAGIVDYTTRFNKPDVVGEYALGWKGPDQDYPAAMYEGEMHNGLWRGMFSPTPILPMTWWWEWHLYSKHYFHFKTAADFVAIMLQEKPDALKEMAVSCSEKQIEYMGLQRDKQLFVWLLNNNEKVQSELTLDVTGADDGNYLARFYNTWSGNFSADTKVSVKNGALELKNIQLPAGGDKAVWLKPASKSSSK
ncbi:DUF5060 domain-containing protein [candidate division KSB1 bacterium]|nr:DUF5060 domain-containing protein [candidate division KSB1 bacterium]